jgi:dynein heavy chain
MRAVKTVINASGILKRKQPNDNEEMLLYRALQDVNKPKVFIFYFSSPTGNNHDFPPVSKRRLDSI